MVLAGAPPAELAGPVRRALAHTLRGAGGLPGLSAASEVVSQVACRELDVRRGLEELLSIERTVQPGPTTALGVDAARGVLAELEFGGEAPADPRYAVAERACWAILGHHFFDLARLNFLGGRFENLSAAHEWEAACRTEIAPDVRTIAAAMARDPTAAKLRAPGRRLPRRSTAELLHQPVPVGSTP